MVVEQEDLTAEGKPRCQGENKDGSQCGRNATTGPYCKTHVPKAVDTEQPDEADEVLAVDVSSLLQAKYLDNALKKRREKKKTEAEDVFYIACPTNHTHVGVFLTRDPGENPIEPNQWYSAYKGIADPWAHPHGLVVCQECKLDGRVTHLRVTPVEGRDPYTQGSAFRVAGSHRRFVRKMGRAEVNRLLEMEVAS